MSSKEAQPFLLTVAQVGLLQVFLVLKKFHEENPDDDFVIM